jgi:D-tagatose-1,6-bisphosphate aldolase subunit GatZ/KbaZ
LLQNVEEQPLPLTLLSQYLPVQYARIRGGEITNDPRAILLDKVRNVLADYSYACGYLTSPV